MKTGMDFRGLIWKRVRKMTFLFVWNRARIWRTGRHTPTNNFQESPREPLPVTHLLFLLFKISIMVKQNHQWVPSSSHPPGRGGGKPRAVTVDQGKYELPKDSTSCNQIWRWTWPKCAVFLRFSVRREQKSGFVLASTSLGRNITVPCFLSVEEFKPHPPLLDIFVSLRELKCSLIWR